MFKFALKLSECFYTLSGKDGSCFSRYKNPLKNTEKLKGQDYNTYLSFYNHADNLCFYYKEQIWEEESQKIIESLFQTTNIAKNKM